MKKACALALLAFLGCHHHHDWGTGLNTVERDYARPAEDMWSASLHAVKASDLTVERDRHDALGGEIVARRADRSPVVVVITSVTETKSRVAVRVEPGDLVLANLIHERIAERAGLGTSRSGLFGGSSLAATYDLDLDACGRRMRSVFTGLNLRLTHEDRHVKEILMDGRMGDSTPVSIRAEVVEPMKMKVTFCAGESRSDDNLAFARRMKAEFERTLP